MLRIKLIITVVTIATISLFSTAPAWAIDCSTCSGSNTLSSEEAIQCGSSCASGTNETPAQSASHLNTTIASIVNVLSLIAGIAAVIMLIVGGFRYITSGGKQESVVSAKNTIIYAIIGLIIVAFAQIIVRFVLHQTTNGASGSNPSSVSQGAANTKH